MIFRPYYKVIVKPNWIFTSYAKILHYGFGLNLDTRDSNAYVSRAERTRCYAETTTFPKANFVVWSMVIRLFMFWKVFPWKRGSFRIATRTFRTRNIRVRITRVQAQSETVVRWDTGRWRRRTWNAKLFTKAIIKRKNYRKSISSFKALRPLLSAGLLNFIWSASKKSKILKFVCWSDCSILVLFVKGLPGLR